MSLFFILLLFYQRIIRQAMLKPVFRIERARAQKILRGRGGKKIFCARAVVFSLFLPAAAGGGQLKFSVGVFLKIGSDFNQNIPPVYTRRVFRLAPPSAGLGVCQDFERIFAFCQNYV